MPLKQASAPPVCPCHFLTSGPESTFTPLTDTAFAVPAYAAFHHPQCHLNFYSILSLHSFLAIPTSTTMSVYRDRTPPSWQLGKLQSSLQPKSGSHSPNSQPLRISFERRPVQSNFHYCLPLSSTTPSPSPLPQPCSPSSPPNKVQISAGPSRSPSCLAATLFLLCSFTSWASRLQSPI